MSQVDVVVDLQVTMKIGFKWPNRTKASASSRRASTARKPRGGKGALSARKPAVGWTINLSNVPKRSLAQIADCDGEDSESEEYYEGLEAALEAFTLMEEASDDFASGFLDGVLSMLPEDALAE